LGQNGNNRTPRQITANGKSKNAETVCPVCGAALRAGQPYCEQCGWLRPAAAEKRLSTAPLPPKEIVLQPQFDRLLVLSAILAFASLYLPWLPGIPGPIVGWSVYYAAPDMPLDILRHWQEVGRRESIFLLNIVGLVAVLFSRTSRHAGLRDLVACVTLVTGGGYLLVYYAHEWGWCFLYNYVGPYAAFTSLALMVSSGLLRTKFMTWVAQSRVLLLVSSAFLLTGFFLPWSLDQSGVNLMVMARQFYWLDMPRVYAYPMAVFPMLGFAAFIFAFHPLPRKTNLFLRLWPLVLGMGALVYFRAVWAIYLSGFPLGSWGTLAGLTILTSAGILDILPSRRFIAKTLAWLFFILSGVVWLSFLKGGFEAISAQFRYVPTPMMF